MDKNELSIQVSELLGAVYQQTSYVGKNADDMDKLAATEDDEALLLRLMRDAASEQGVFSEKYLRFGNMTEARIVYEVALPETWNMTLEALKGVLSDYLCSSVCRRFFSLSDSEAAKRYAEQEVISKEKVRSCLFSRKNIRAWKSS